MEMGDKSKHLRTVVAYERGGVLVVCFRVRNVVLPLDVQDAGEELLSVLEGTQHRKIVLDFGALKHISSGFITRIIVFQNRLKAKGGRVALCGLGPGVAKVFKLLGLEKVMLIAKDEYEAAHKLLET